MFIDPKLGSTRFAEECVKWISRHPGTDATKEAYRNILHAHVEPVLGDRTLAGVAQARDDVLDLLTVRLGAGSNSRRKIARALITGVLDEGVRAGKITMHRCGGIVLPDNGTAGDHGDFVFPSHGQLLALAGGIRHPVTVWLMRGCGLRIEEALAVRKSCFRDGGTVLCVFEQASRDGSQCHLDDSRRICLAGQAQPVFPLHSPVVADSRITQHARNIRNLQILRAVQLRATDIEPVAGQLVCEGTDGRAHGVLIHPPSLYQRH